MGCYFGEMRRNGSKGEVGLAAAFSDKELKLRIQLCYDQSDIKEGQGETVVLEERMLTRTLDATVFFIWVQTSKMGSLPLSLKILTKW